MLKISWLEFIIFCDKYRDNIFYVQGNCEAYSSEYYETINTIKEVLIYKFI